MGRYGSHVEQTYRNAFGLKKSKSIDWLKLNVSLAKRFFDKQGRWAIGISPLQRPHYFTSSYTYLFSKKVILLSFLG